MSKPNLANLRTFCFKGVVLKHAAALAFCANLLKSNLVFAKFSFAFAVWHLEILLCGLESLIENFSLRRWRLKMQNVKTEFGFVLG